MHSRSLSVFILLSVLSVGGVLTDQGAKLLTKSFHPKVNYEVYGDGVTVPRSKTQRGVDFKDVAISFITSKLGIQEGEVVYKSGFSSDIVDHAYFKQAYNNFTFTNAVANVVLKDGKVVAFGSSFVPIDTSKFSSPVPSIPLSSAISTAEEKLTGIYNEHPTTLEYFVKRDDFIALVHVMQIRNESEGTWYQAHVDAHSGELISATNFIAQDSYLAVEIIKQSIIDGQSIQTNPQNTVASPLGWQLPIPGFRDNQTRGNNVFARLFTTDRPVAETSKGNNFNYPYRVTTDPSEGQNPSAAAVNAFYVLNEVHDISYLYGFTEKSFNFQFNNFGKGGEEADGVIVSVQDTRKTNNADFATPPDGQSGLCRMFLFDFFEVKRDTDMDNSVLVHEATHGITNRLTGGGSADCLGTGISRGLGEGWSDMMANWMEQTSENTRDFVLGVYVSGSARGIRRYPYSTNPDVNPLRFSDLNFVSEVHDAGEIWANMLHNVYAVLVESHGFSDTAKTDASPRKGNVMFMHLFMDALSGQPCEPTFIKARDAIVQADQNRYNGDNKCLIWKAFASRGMGTNAKESDEGFEDGDDVPQECERDD